MTFESDPLPEPLKAYLRAFDRYLLARDYRSAVLARLEMQLRLERDIRPDTWEGRQRLRLHLITLSDPLNLASKPPTPASTGKGRIGHNMEFAQITQRLSTGGSIGPTDMGFLLMQGITAIIDCVAGEDDRPIITAGINYLWNPTEDDGQHKPPAWFKASLDFALPLFADPRQRIYAHCHGGHNRGPSTAYALMRALGWTSAEALALIKAARPSATVAYAGDADQAIITLGYGK